MRIPFKNEALNKATGGIISGTITEISGESSSGKSFLLYDLIASTIDMGGYALLCDPEGAYDSSIAKVCNINVKSGRFFMMENAKGEPVSDIEEIFAEAYRFMSDIRKSGVKKNIPIVIGVDSFGATSTGASQIALEKGEKAKGYDSAQLNAQLSSGFKKITSKVRYHNANLVFLNQTRDAIGVTFGDPTKSLAEKIFSFYPAQRIRGKLSQQIVTMKPSLKKKEGIRVKIGVSSIWKTIKNRAVVPFQVIDLKIFYNKGIKKYEGLDELLINDGTVKVAYEAKKKDKKEKEDIEGEKKKAKKIIGLVYKDQTYSNAEELVKQCPEVLTPKWLDIEVDEDTEIVEEDAE